MDRKKAFFLWKIILTIASFVGIILTKIQCVQTIPMQVIYDLSVGIFSSMILIWFIDEINEHIQDKQTLNKEIKEIKRSDRLIQLYIERYKLFFYCLITPIKKRKFDNIEIHSDFLFKDMQDLYQTTLLINEGIFDSSIESFIKAECVLKEEMEKMIKDIDFSYYPNIQEHLIEFVEVSLKYNQKVIWLEAKTTDIGGQTLADAVTDVLKEKADDLYAEYQNGKDLSNNLIMPYFALFEMLKGEQKALSKYEQEIKRLDKQSAEKDR